MNLVRIPGIIKDLIPGLTWDVPGPGKIIYLTFDDGPTPGITDQVLAILKEFSACATFFCIGRNAERHPDMIAGIREAGHALGNHTYSHLKGWYASDTEYFNDIALAARYIPSGLYRPPYGRITPSQIRHLRPRYRIVMWDVMSYDFDPRVTGERCLKNVIRCTNTGSVIVFHDSIKASEKVLYALPRVLELFRMQGFVFGSIPAQGIGRENA